MKVFLFVLKRLIIVFLIKYITNIDQKTPNSFVFGVFLVLKIQFSCRLSTKIDPSFALKTDLPIAVQVVLIFPSFCNLFVMLLKRQLKKGVLISMFLIFITKTFNFYVVYCLF